MAAALAVLAIAELKNQMTAMVSAVQQKFADLRATILSTVAAFRPFEVERFNRRMRDLHAVIGQMMLPVLRAATKYVSQFADYIYSLPASFRSAITSLAKVGVVLGVIVAAGGALVSVAGVLLKVASPVGWVVTALGYLINTFRQTAGGAKALQGALKFGEEAIAGLLAAMQAVWDRLQPIRDRLSASLSELGDALADLFESMKPLLSAGLAGAAALAVTALSTLMTGIRFLADQVTKAVNVINRAAARLGLKNLLPSTDRKTNSSFGMGSLGASVTNDLAGVYRKMQEEIISNTGGKENPDEETAKNTGVIAARMDELLKMLPNILKNPLGSESLPDRAKIGKSAAFGLGGNMVLGMFRA